MNFVTVVISTIIVGLTAMVAPARVAACEATPKPAAAIVARERAPAFSWPVTGRVIQDTCSPERHRTGIEIAASEGAVVKAAADGIVAYAGDELRSFRNLIVIRHADGWFTAYAGNSQMMVKRGDAVRRGQPIAVVGEIAGMNVPGLHLEIRKGNSPLNPTEYLHRRRNAT